MLSVIVPAFNRRDLILPCVTSLLEQDFVAPYEVVVVDDGSTDGTAEIVAGMDPRVRVVRQINLGAGVARYAGVCAARGNLVAFLDSDCTARPNHLSALWQALRQQPDVVLAFPAIELPRMRRIQLEQVGNAPESIVQDPLERLLSAGHFIYATNMMTYRQIALKCGRDRGRFRAANDYDLSLRIATFGKFAFVNECTVHQNFPADGISKQFGHFQIGFAVLAARDAVRFSGRADAGILAALRRRVEHLWPLAAVKLVAASEYRLGFEVAGVGLKYGRWSVGLRRLWWAIDHHLTGGRVQRSAVGSPNVPDSHSVGAAPASEANSIEVELRQ
ncbi:MAG: glycosyltransferase family 2 protein [Planctomycetes bacterium]|nr:glycosyltransferase family 2 protein [Planctomycetota bacterium]